MEYHLALGGVFMRRSCRRPRPRPLGCAAILAGVAILLGMILPAGFWWVALAIALIALGIWLIRC